MREVKHPELSFADIVITMSYLARMEIFKWNAEKNEILAKERGITFKEAG